MFLRILCFFIYLLLIVPTAFSDTIRYPSGNVYTGDVLRINRTTVQRHGYGKLTKVDGETYVGEWQRDSRHGSGINKWPDGNAYDGEWYENTKHGYGTYTFPSGNVYKGEWLNDKQTGRGTMLYTDGRVYTGQWLDTDKHGYGKLTYKNGASYAGNWAYGYMSGKGLYTYDDGTTYEGDFLESNFNGSGVLTEPSGTIYKGSFKDDLRHGYGISSYHNGSRYVGNWSKGKWNGKGKFTSNQGFEYEGDFLEGNYHGYGIYKYSNGDVYKGNWENDKRNGAGVYTYADGTSISAIWKDDEPLDIRYGSLALIPEEGSFVGIATDKVTREEAELSALETCQVKANKKCVTVLTWSGSSHLAFNYLNQVGKAGSIYAWALGSTLEEAETSARVNCLKKARGKPCSEIILKENTGTGEISTLYSLAEMGVDNYLQVTIGSNIWLAENLQLTKFQNGDPITESKSAEEWVQNSKNKVPTFMRHPNSKFGLVYNYPALTDSRRLAPIGWRIPTAYDYRTLCSDYNTDNNCARKHRSKEGWRSFDADYSWGNGTNESGFNALPGLYVTERGSFVDYPNVEGTQVRFWTQSTCTSEGFVSIVTLNSWSMKAKCVEPTALYLGNYVRLIKE